MASFLDVNECEIGTPCVNSDCINVNGSYTCSPCYHGFSRSNHSQAPCGEFKKGISSSLLVYLFCTGSLY